MPFAQPLTKRLKGGAFFFFFFRGLRVFCWKNGAGFARYPWKKNENEQVRIWKSRRGRCKSRVNISGHISKQRRAIPCFPDISSSCLSLYGDHNTSRNSWRVAIKNLKYLQRLAKFPPSYPLSIILFRFVYLMLFESLPIKPSQNEKKTVLGVFLCPSNNLIYTWQNAKMLKKQPIRI